MNEEYARGRADERAHLQSFFNNQGCGMFEHHANMSHPDILENVFFFCQECGCELSAFEIENNEGYCIDCRRRE